MATPPDAVRSQLAVVTASASADLSDIASQASPARRLAALLNAVPLVVPAYYDAAGTLAVSWYDERRDESNPSTPYVPRVIGDPATDWIEREAAAFRRSLDDDRLVLDEITRLAEKEIARGFRDSILGNSRMDEDAIGWSRVARGAACKFCLMLAGNGAFYRSETSARFAAHKGCNCAAQPEFRNGKHGPEANVVQYLASNKTRTPEQRARVREYLNDRFPDAPG